MEDKFTINFELLIRELLFEYDCIVVPGFGGFVTYTEHASIVFDKNFSQYQIDRKAGLNMTQGQWPGLRISNSLLPEYEDTRYSVYIIKWI